MDSVKASTLGTATAYAIHSSLHSLVPYAMSAFGTVVSGVGTIHTAGGVAATVQSLAAVTASSTFLGVGALVGVLVFKLR